MDFYKELSERVIGAAIEVHRELGPGLLESAYQRGLCHELSLRNIPFQQLVEVPVFYKSEDLGCGFVADIIVDGKIIIELKAVETLIAVHESQLFTYLKLTKIKLGLLMNFNVPLLKDGIKRRVL